MSEIVEMAAPTQVSSLISHPWSELTVGNYFLLMPYGEAKRIVQIEESDLNPNILVVRFRMGYPPSQMSDIAKDASFQRIGKQNS